MLSEIYALTVQIEKPMVAVMAVFAMSYQHVTLIRNVY